MRRWSPPAGLAICRCARFRWARHPSSSGASLPTSGAGGAPVGTPRMCCWWHRHGTRPGRTRACRSADSAPAPLAAAGGAISAAGSAGPASITTASSPPTNSPSSCNAPVRLHKPGRSTQAARPAKALRHGNGTWTPRAAPTTPSTRAWTVYEQPLPGIRLTCRQLSPILPHNYRESSFPVGHFLWRIENTGDTPVTVGLMFTFQNGRGTENDIAGGHSNRAFRLQYAAGTVESGPALRGASRRVENGEMPLSAVRGIGCCRR